MSYTLVIQLLHYLIDLLAIYLIIAALDHKKTEEIWQILIADIKFVKKINYKY